MKNHCFPIIPCREKCSSFCSHILFLFIIGKCTDDYCQNGGTCQVQTKDKACKCTSSYTGEKCETGTVNIADILLIAETYKRDLCKVCLKLNASEHFHEW